MECSGRTRLIRCLSSIVFAFFLFSGVEAGARDSFQRTAEYRIAAGYLQQARVLYRDGEFRSAAQLLEVSLEFFPEYSESAFLAARIYLREQETTWRAIEYLERAVDSATWTETEPLAAATELIRLYVRTYRFEDAQSLFRRFGETGLGGRGNSDLSALWARTLTGLGREGDARDFLSESVRRFPRSSDLYLLQAQALVRGGLRGAAVDVLERGIKEIPGEVELIYQLAVLEQNADRREELIETYLQAGGDDPAAPLLGAIAGDSNRDRYVDLFFRMGGNARVGYLGRLRQVLAPAEVSDRTGGYTGTRVLDSDRDGSYEQRYTYREGVLAEWLSDADQNGIPEIIVEFREDIPRKVMFRIGGSSPVLEYRYSEYPYLETASFFNGSERAVYTMMPYTFRRPVFLDIPPPLTVLQPRADAEAAEESIRRNAYQRTEYSSDTGFPQRRLHLLEGFPVRVEELPDATGTFTRTVYYDGSLPVEAVRDLDGDGDPEIREMFRSGELWKITLDQDGDGVNEFEQMYESEMTRTYWDYDDDGSFDSREDVQADGSRVRSFSSALNGAFDLGATVEVPR